MLKESSHYRYLVCDFEIKLVTLFLVTSGCLEVTSTSIKTSAEEFSSIIVLLGACKEVPLKHQLYDLTFHDEKLHWNNSSFMLDNTCTDIHKDCMAPLANLFIHPYNHQQFLPTINVAQGTILQLITRQNTHLYIHTKY